MASTPATKRKTKRRTKAQIETDRRLAALRKNLAAEIEADIGRFAGDSQSPMAGLLVMTRVKIILAFLQAFFPMFIKPPKPRRVARKAPARRRRAVTTTRKRPSGRRTKPSTAKTRAKIRPTGNGFAVGTGLEAGEVSLGAVKAARVVRSSGKTAGAVLADPTQVRVIAVEKTGGES
jgi:hypothetical protein